ncbi:hypothetical protein [Methanoculleus taiwanensis]|uniref:hypothetical protein n=1 Tax=Methanoculleus taiwanensis TaxID=1550565 RepID=UPI001F4F7AE2|nr:hypothetical protein [Methanoculleus taiwanensis]
MLFADRLEVWNPGRLPPSLTLEKLRQAHGSVPGFGSRSGAAARVAAGITGSESPPAPRGRAEVQSRALQGTRTERDLGPAEQGRPPAPG